MKDGLDQVEDALEGKKIGRRSFLATLGTAGITAVAGCNTGTGTEDNTTTTAPTTTTEEPEPTTEEPTTTEDPAKSFEEIYHETYDHERGALRREQIEEIKDQNWQSFGHKMEQVNTYITERFPINNDSQELTKHLKRAVHNELEYSTDQVRVLGRDGAGGGTYTAVFHRDDNNDWIKDLALPGKGEGPYLRHNETNIDQGDEAERGLTHIWDVGTGTNSATSYHAIDEGNNAKDHTWDDLMEWISKGNDHIVVGDEYEEPNVDYTVPAAKKLAEIQNFNENDTFNEEMQIVEEATETFHNTEEPYLKMEIKDGKLVPTPTEEYIGPENLYG